MAKQLELVESKNNVTWSFLYLFQDTNNQHYCHISHREHFFPLGNGKDIFLPLEFLIGDILDKLLNTEHLKIAQNIDYFLARLETHNKCFNYEAFDFMCLTYDIKKPEVIDVMLNEIDSESDTYVPCNLNSYEMIDKFIQDKDVIKSYLVCCTNNMEILIALLYYISKFDFKFKRCKRCKKWFIVHKTDEIYCKRIKKGLTCKTLAIKEKRKERENKENYKIQKMVNSIRTGLSSWVAESSGEEYTRRLKYKDEFTEQWKITNKTKTDEEKITFLKSYQKNGKNYFRKKG